MEFLYPKFNTVTHVLNKLSSNSISYPNDVSYATKEDYAINENTKICLIRDNIGADCAWSQVLTLDGPNKDKIIYVLSKDLTSTNKKVSYTPICSLENSIDQEVAEIDPNTKEILIPYIDKKNGLYSVRIQTDAEKATNSFILENLINEVFYEGISILLSSRGIRYDIEYIEELLQKYHRFAYVNNDLDTTINRQCEALTFTVSIPLNFFNEEEIAANTTENARITPTKILEFNSRNFKSNIDTLLQIFLSREDDIQKLLYPNNFIENFVLAFELASIRKFAVQFSEFVALQNFSINEFNTVNFYEIGLDDSLNVVDFKIENISRQKVLSPSELTGYRLISELGSKRIYNYLLNLRDMSDDIKTMDIKEFIYKYVKYPDPRILTDSIVINGNRISDEKAKQFKQDYAKSAEECINLSDIATISRSVRDIASYSDPLYHIFIKKDIKNLEDYNTYKSFVNEGQSTKQALSSLNDVLKSKKAPQKQFSEGEKKIKNDLIASSDKQIQAKEKEKEPIVREYESAAKNLEAAQKQLDEINKRTGPKTPEEEAKKQQLEKEVKKFSQITNETLDKKREIDDSLSVLESQKSKIQATAPDVLAQDKDLEKYIGDNQAQIDGFADAFKKLRPKDEILDALLSNTKVNFAYSNAVDTIEYVSENQVNLSTIIYILNRINLSYVLFEKLFCSLAGLSPDSEEVRAILDQIPPEVVAYFNYLRSVKELNGTTYIQALERGTAPDIKIFCAQNNGLIYFVKGLKKLLASLDRAATVAFDVIPTFGQTRLLAGSTNPYEVFVKNFTQNMIRTITSLLLDLISDLLSNNCEDPLRNANNQNTSPVDPFSTHYPLGGFNDSRENNNNPNVLSNNRGDVLEKIYFRELQFGFDKEYTVDLIGRLLKDVNCILTPIESVNLLKGEVTDVVKALIKNIIRAKYSTPPNDLSFLLTDEEKLKQFFKELGLTVDPDYLSTVTQVTSNYLEASRLCDEPTLKAREQLLNNKVPKELGTLERQQQKRIKTAKKLFDRIKEGGAGGGGTVIEISPLCPDFTNDEIENAKDLILTEYENSVKNTFSNVISDFTQEAKQLSNIHTDTLPWVFKDEDGNITESVNYTLYNYELGTNLKPIKQSALSPPPDPNVNSDDRVRSTQEYDKRIDYELVGDFNTENNNIFGTKYKYRPITSIENLGALSQILAPKDQNENFSFACPDKTFTLDTGFDKFLDDNNIIVEFADDFQFDSENGDLSEYYDKSEDKFNSRDGRFLKSKKYFMTISLDRDFGNADVISMKLIYNNKIVPKLEIKAEVPYEGDISPDFTSDDVVDALDKVLDSSAETITGRTVPGTFQLETYDIQSADEDLNDVINREKNKPLTIIELNDADDIYLLTKQVFNNIEDNRVKSLIQEVYLDKFKPQIEKLEKLEATIGQYSSLNELGFFNTETLVDIKNNTINKTLNITTSKLEPRQQNLLTTYIPSASFIVEEKQFFTNTDFKKYISVFDKTIGKLKLYLYNTKAGSDEFPDSPQPAKYYIIERNGLDFQENTNETTEITTHTFDSSKDIQQKYYAAYTLLDYPQDQRYINCNIYPHYLNLDYILQLAKISKRSQLCDIGNYNINDILKICLVELTVRTYVTDLLIKSVPYLSTFTTQNLLDIYKNPRQINIIKHFFKNDLKIFSTSPDNKTPGSESVYHKYFIKMVKEVYELYKKDNLLKQKFITEGSLEKEIDYFIKKEIYRFIKYAIDKKILFPDGDIPSVDVYEELSRIKIKEAFLESGIDIAILPSESEEFKAYEDFIKYWKFEYETFMMYFMMAETVDNKKRSIFYSTKSDLASIFFSNLGDLQALEDTDANIVDNSERSQEDIIKFLQNLTASPNPAAVALLKPEYSKYVKKFLNLTLETSRNTLSTLAENTDPNISLTKKVNFLTTFFATTAFSFLDEKSRTLAIINDPTLVTKRISDGRSPTPDLLVSLGISFFIPPLLSGIAYLATDTIFESTYMINASREVDALAQSIKNSIGQADINSCDITPADKIKGIDSVACSPDNKVLLRHEINSLESEN